MNICIASKQKERSRFSLRFNIGDPVQRTAVELLELQPPHSKSQYIANALAYYNANFADDPQPVKVAPPVIDRTTMHPRFPLDGQIHTKIRDNNRGVRWHLNNIQLNTIQKKR